MKELTLHELFGVSAGLDQYQVDYTFYIASFDYLSIESALKNFQSKAITINQLMEIILPYVRPTDCNPTANCITVHILHAFT